MLGKESEAERETEGEEKRGSRGKVRPRGERGLAQPLSTLGSERVREQPAMARRRATEVATAVEDDDRMILQQPPGISFSL